MRVLTTIYGLFFLLMVLLLILSLMGVFSDPFIDPGYKPPRNTRPDDAPGRTAGGVLRALPRSRRLA